MHGAPGSDEALQFCNAFWGENDAGFQVIQSHSKNTFKTLEDLRSFYKERAEIELDYSKKLAKLAKTPLGRYEVGPIRHALDTVRTETDSISRSHHQLAQSIRKEVDQPLYEFIHRADGMRRPSQLAVEKLHRHKVAQTQYVARAREKYEHDCTKVNAYTAQSNLVQGRDLDKLMMKLERVQATVGGNDADYQSYVHALQDTTQKWNAEWKSHLDICQDVEEDRQEFLKSNLWNLANAISTVCVSDDEACERVRVALEACEAIRDVYAFVSEFGTGPAIPVAPEYINYAQGQVHPTAPEFETAHFERLSTRGGTYASVPTGNLGPRTPPPQVSLTPTHMGRTPPPQASLTPAHMGRTPPPIGRTPPPMGRTPPPMGRTPPPLGRTPPPAVHSPHAGRTATPNALGASPFQSVPSRDSIFAPGGPPLSPRGGTPRQQTPRVAPPSLPPPSLPAQDEDPDDPINKALANLRLRQSRKSPAPGSRPTSMAVSEHSEAHPIPAPESARGADMIPHSRTMPASAAAIATGAPPFEPAPAQPPHPPPSTMDSTPASSNVRNSMPPGGSVSDPRMFQRPVSPAAAFMRAPERTPSPAYDRIVHNYGQAFPSERRSGSPTKPTPQRASTPLGIALDAQGSVTQDEMADNYRREPVSVPGGFPADIASEPAEPDGYAAPADHAAQGQVPASAYESHVMPPPTGQYSENGEPILFYVKALYDYAATMPEEFSFTAGDIIAVTHTEPDGWWQGELLDENRRVPGANTFPSNFVVLLM
ncbi:formin-binding protein [Malassezia cuniculi]|uniref:Formin-binding protein n=1 Tax=Malassezia cuniculi TaxID=948313 RepID=A0AAF0ET53_9BASI|nr:formin-binding protein [Malassezia cuniculi]